MKLLYLADIRFPMERANGIQTAHTAHALARRGLEVVLVVRKTDARSDDECLAFFGLEPHPGLRLVRVPTALGRVGYLSRALLLLLRASRWDALYTRDLLLADLVLSARVLHRLPVFYEAHTVSAIFAGERAELYENVPASSRRKVFRLDRRERRVCQRATGVVAITAGLRDALEARHLPVAPIEVVPDGCSLPEEPPSPYAPHEPLRVCYMGQLYPWKGVGVLVESMRHVESVELTIVGGLPPEPDLERLKRRASELSVEDRVRFVGYLPPPELGPEKERADVFAIPLADSETARLFTSPLKLFEAMAARRPIVASDLPAVREVLAHETSALLVRPGHPRALGEAIARLASEPELARSLAERAYEDVQAYSWEKRAERIESFLSRALRSRGGP